MGRLSRMVAPRLSAIQVCWSLNLMSACPMIKLAHRVTAGGHQSTAYEPVLAVNGTIHGTVLSHCMLTDESLR